MDVLVKYRHFRGYIFHVFSICVLNKPDHRRHACFSFQRARFRMSTRRLAILSSCVVLLSPPWNCWNSTVTQTTNAFSHIISNSSFTCLFPLGAIRL